MPKVSIIIPVYNVEKYLKQCLDSVINQTLKDIEIICVNDCSPDNSLSILKEYASKDNRIKIIQLKENSGLGKVRNIALKEVSSDYIMFLDSDDWYELNACELAYNQIVKNNNDFVFFDLYIYKEQTNEKNKDEKRIGQLKDFLNLPSVKFSDIERPFMSFCESWYKIYKRDFIIKNNLKFEERKSYEDIPFYYNLILSNPDFSILDVPIYNYRKREGAITAKPSYWKDLVYVRDKMYYRMLESKNEKYIDYYVISYIRSLIGHYKKFSKIDNLFEVKHYNEIRKIFLKLNKNHNIKNYKDYIDYAFFEKTINTTSFMKLLKSILKNIFSISNSPDRKRKIVTILGIKIKYKK